MAESGIGCSRPLIRRRGLWRNPDQVEIATLEYLDWLNLRRIGGEIGLVRPAEFEEVFLGSRVKQRIKD